MYQIIGAGKCDLNLEKKLANFRGGSIDYDIGIDKEHLQRLMSEFPDWEIE